ncbi:hypothetical protein ACFP2F_07410 [Hymenobacter artigasi]|uniref:Peptidylprolyl isomerase n=1 Tax=Hymenobacter artigasi TaxID=2719616 RepID=A0ABX1HJ55_9BACT|nr:hypothetical protein [Hymenobacter artigasi]NKI89077.1 hypothetical protein [Hymenobacter artigasi]
MKTIFSCCLLSGLLFASSGCQKCEEAPAVTSESCASDKQPVKTVTNVEGTIGFEPALQQYYVRRVIPGTYDSVDFGMLCGTLPTNLQRVGNQVLFSGTYKPYDKQPPLGPAGRTFYYLEVTKALVQKKDE